MPIQPNDYFLVNTTDGLKKITYDNLFSGLDNGAPVTISEDAPAAPSEGDLWWADSTEFDGGGRLYIYTGNEWVDTSLPTGSGEGSGVEELGAIGDVTLTNLKNADIITWNGIRWVNSTAPPADISGNSINDLNDVDGSSANVGDILVWNNVAGEWQSQAQPAIPDKTSDLTNDSGFITASEAPVQPGDIPTSTQQLTNDSGFITSADLPTNTSDLNNDSGFITDPGVSQIIAGTNVTISPINGTGQVIINAAGGGGGAVDSVNGEVGDVVLDLGDLNDVEFNNLRVTETIAWNGTAWVNVLAGSGGTGDYVKLDDGGTEQSIVGGGGIDILGGITSEFGSSAAQLGNVAPLNDWSVYPVRA